MGDLRSAARLLGVQTELPPTDWSRNRLDAGSQTIVREVVGAMPGSRPDPFERKSGRLSRRTAMISMQRTLDHERFRCRRMKKLVGLDPPVGQALAKVMIQEAIQDLPVFFQAIGPIVFAHKVLGRFHRLFQKR